MAPEPAAAAASAAQARPAMAVRLPALAELTRPHNAAMTAFAVAVGALVQAGPALAPLGAQLGLAALAGFAFAGAGNALNDWVDRDLDAVAHPRRPLPSGRLASRDALALQASLFAVAVVASAFLSLMVLVVVLAALVLMVGYELRLKDIGLPGNVAIAALTGVPFVFGALAVAGGAQLTPSAGVLAGLAFLATLGREIIKDVEDVAGDVGRRRTLPMRIGETSALRLAQAALLVGVVLSPLPALARPGLGLAYLPLVGLADAGFLAAAVRASEPRLAQRLCKAAMLVALVAFAAGRWSA